MISYPYYTNFGKNLRSLMISSASEDKEQQKHFYSAGGSTH